MLTVERFRDRRLCGREPEKADGAMAQIEAFSLRFLRVCGASGAVEREDADP